MLAYQRDPRYLRFYTWTNRTEAEVRAFVQMFLDQQADLPRRKFQPTITLSDSERLIGNCGIRRKPENGREANIGLELAPEYWGKAMPPRLFWLSLTSGFESWSFTASRPGA